MKYDYYAQLVFAAILAVFALFALIPSHGGWVIMSLLGLMPLGVWQLISAGVNTARFKNDPGKMLHLKRYWTASICCLVVFFGTFAIYKAIRGVADVFLYASMVGSVVVAIYYLFIYKKYLIGNAKEDRSIRSISEPVEI